MFAPLKAATANHFLRCVTLALLTLMLAFAVAAAALVAAVVTLCKAASSSAPLF